jgi:tetratricopeptide (TPR) repeat protein
MARRAEPVRKSVKEILADLREGHRAAALMGPAAALKYLQRTLAAHANYPYAVRTVAYDLLAEAQAQLGEWEGCAASVEAAIEHLEDAQAEFPHGFRSMLEGLTCFERGIQARSELGDFRAALELAEAAVAMGLGQHYQAKADSLGWARD